MKKSLLISLISLFTVAAFAGNPSNGEAKASGVLVSGKIIDKISGEEITGAEIKIDNKTVYSDLNGNFSAVIDVKHTEATVKYVSYKDTKTKINPFTYNTIVIELDSK